MPRCSSLAKARTRLWAASSAAVLALACDGSAQHHAAPERSDAHDPTDCDVFGPQVADFRFTQSQFYDQVWAQVARGPNRIGFAWSAGQDVLARVYDLNLQPITPDFLVNTVLTEEVQDEPAIAFSNAGTMLVAWSERHGYDG